MPVNALGRNENKAYLWRGEERRGGKGKFQIALLEETQAGEVLQPKVPHLVNFVDHNGEEPLRKNCSLGVRLFGRREIPRLGGLFLFREVDALHVVLQRLLKTESARPSDGTDKVTCRVRRDDYLVVQLVNGSLERAFRGPKLRVSGLWAVVSEYVNTLWAKKRLQLGNPLRSQGSRDDDQMGEALNVLAIQKWASLYSMPWAERAGMRSDSRHCGEYAHLGWVEGAPYVLTRGIR